MPRRAPHFKILASIRNHRHTLGVLEDDALTAMYVRAGLLAVERFADRTGDSFLLSSKDLEWLAGCRGVANARRKLGRLEANTRLTVGQAGAGFRLTFPNFAEKQGFKTRNGSETARSASASASASATKKRKSKPAPRACVFPESGLTAEQIERLDRLAKKAGFSDRQIAYAQVRVRDWSHANRKARADWVLTTLNAMRDGWALKGMPVPPPPSHTAWRPPEPEDHGPAEPLSPEEQARVDLFHEQRQRRH